MAENKKVTDIKYKQMDKDPEIKKVSNEMERSILGEKGVGLMDALSMTPGRVQRFLDEENEKEFDRILAENKEYILEERTNRAIAKIEAGEYKVDNPEDMQSVFNAAVKEQELIVIQELLKKEGMI